MRSRLLIEHPETGDWYYTGPLPAAQRVAALDAYPHVTTRDDGSVSVLLCHTEPPPNATPEEAWGVASEWGAGATTEEAWRYVLGAAFGPPYDGYDESHLWTLLQIHDDPRPARTLEATHA